MKPMKPYRIEHLGSVWLVVDARGFNWRGKFFATREKAEARLALLNSGGKE